MVLAAAHDNCPCRHKHRWLGFLDVDEFVVLHTAADAADTETQQDATEAQARPDIRALLSQYEAFGGLALNWVMFGSNGHLQRPRGGVLVSYHACLPLQHRCARHAIRNCTSDSLIGGLDASTVTRPGWQCS